MGLLQAIRMFFRSIPEAGRGSDRVRDHEPKKVETKVDTSLSTPDRAIEVGERAERSESDSK